MKFIEQSYEILTEDFTRERVINTIARAARTCYQSEPKTEDANAKLVKRLVTSGHEAMIEHGPQLSVKFITCRGVSHEMVRNRLFSFAQESTRYVKYGKSGEDGKKEPMLFIIPPWIKGDSRKLLLSSDWLPMEAGAYENVLNNAEISYTEALARTEQYYSELIDFGWKPQQAREVLPNALKTEIIVTGNLRQWRHFFYLRCDTPAHPQIRELMIPLFNEVRGIVPELFDDIAEKISLEQ